MGSSLPAKPAEQTNWVVRFLLICAVLVLFVLGIAATFFSEWRWHLRQNINAKTAAIKAAGLPLNWEDLSRWPAVIPDDKNMAFIYTNAIAHLDAKFIPDAVDFREFLGPLSTEARAKLQVAIEINLPAIQIIAQVSDASKSRYPVNYLDGQSAQLPHLAGLKQLAVVLGCDAILKAGDSNTAAASEDVRSSLKISESLDNEPILISQLTSAGILNLSCDSLEGVLRRTPLPEEQLSRLESQFTQIESTNRFLTGLIGERATMNEFIRLAQDDVNKMIEIANQGQPDDNQTQLLPRNPGAGWRFIGFGERDRNFFLGGMATNIFFIQEGPPASLAMRDEDNRLGEQAKSELYIFSAMFLPTLSVIGNRDAFVRAYLRDAITALPVERWRLQHHDALPDSLDDLVPAFLPAVPIDPYDGKPLRYKKLEKGYCIYSIGPNLKDDGGRDIPLPSAKVTRDERMNYDIVFIVDR
jgi:hypothetical protein